MSSTSLRAFVLGLVTLGLAGCGPDSTSGPKSKCPSSQSGICDEISLSPGSRTMTVGQTELFLGTTADGNTDLQWELSTPAVELVGQPSRLRIAFGYFSAVSVRAVAVGSSVLKARRNGYEATATINVIR